MTWHTPSNAKLIKISHDPDILISHLSNIKKQHGVCNDS